MQLLSHLSAVKKALFGEDDYIKEVWLFVVLSLSLYYIISLASFNPLDPSVFSSKLPPEPITNYGGYLGSLISAYSFYYFGLISYFLPLPFCINVLGYKIFNKKLFLLNLAGWVFLFMSFSLFLHAISPTFMHTNISLSTSGSIGYFIFESSSFSVGPFGSAILGITCFLVGLDLVTKRSLFSPLKRHLAFIWLKVRSKLNFPLFSGGFSWRWSLFQKKQQLADETGGLNILNKSLLSNEGATSPLGAKNIPDLPFSIIQPPSAIPPTQKLKTLPQDELDQDFIIKNGPQSTPKPEESDPLTFLDNQTDTLENSMSELDEPVAYVPPKLEILNTTHVEMTGDFEIQELQQTAELLIQTFEEFNLKGEIIAVQPGPVVTVFEFRPSAGVKLNKVMGLMDDLALALKVDSIFINPVPGKRALGIQVPNKNRKMVLLGDIVSSPVFQDNTASLIFGMGKSIDGTPFCCDLTKMPHLLVAGATGSGKSVGINSLLCSILMKSGPEDVRLLLVDPKMLELSIYEGIPHLLMPVITEPTKAGAMLRWAVQEMDKRYRIMQMSQVRNIAGFNAFWAKATPQKREEINELIRDEYDDEITSHKLPLILIIIDELADLMLTAPKEIESLIQRLAQKARASGIHLVLATQRPSVDVITGVIKANLPSRVAFQVVSKHDSRTILDQVGAEKLLGKGDMLMQTPGKQRLDRIQGAFVDDDEVINLVEELKRNWTSTYDNKVMEWVENNTAQAEEGSGSGYSSNGGDCDDEKFDLAVEIAANHGSISASYLQRKLKIGYNRAARIVEAMEEQGMIGAASGSKPRKWLGPVYEEI